MSAVAPRSGTGGVVPSIAIVDYGMGNLRSVEKAFERVGASAFVTSDRQALEGADGIVLPGVGAFPRAMERIREAGLDLALAELVDAQVPLLGVCLGMQLLFERSDELGGAQGLGFLAGEVTPLEAPGLKVPHMGWEPVRWVANDPLVEGVDDGTPFFFVHSLAPRASEPSDVLGTAAFGDDDFCCAVARPPVFGLQFHPEKSSAAGLALLANFATVCAHGTPQPA